MHRVQKIISNNGFCSRRKAEEYIKAGLVKVNGKVITIGDKAEENDEITINDKPLEKQEKIYVKFHKPVGYVTALRDRHERTIMELINIKERVFPIGRLDKETSGLLILTNDGDFANNVMHPRYELEKTYIVGFYTRIEPAKVRALEKGIILKDGKTNPAKLKFIHEKLLEITIHEGKNRLIRRMFEKLGYEVKFLKRVRVGKLNLGELPEGRYAFLKPSNGKSYPDIF